MTGLKVAKVIFSLMRILMLVCDVYEDCGFECNCEKKLGNAIHLRMVSYPPNKASLLFSG